MKMKGFFEQVGNALVLYVCFAICLVCLKAPGWSYYVAGLLAALLSR